MSHAMVGTVGIILAIIVLALVLVRKWRIWKTCPYCDGQGCAFCDGLGEIRR